MAFGWFFSVLHVESAHFYVGFCEVYVENGTHDVGMIFLRDYAWKTGRVKSILFEFSLCIWNLELSGLSDSGVSKSVSLVSARKHAYRKASVALAVINAGLCVVGSSWVYFLLEPFVLISAGLMILGAYCVWMEQQWAGVVTIGLGCFLGGFFGLSSVLWALLSAAFGSWVYGLPLAPVGFIIPIAGCILALMSR